MFPKSYLLFHHNFICKGNNNVTPYINAHIHVTTVPVLFEVAPEVPLLTLGFLGECSDVHFC